MERRTRINLKGNQVMHDVKQQPCHVPGPAIEQLDVASASAPALVNAMITEFLTSVHVHTFTRLWTRLCRCFWVSMRWSNMFKNGVCIFLGVIKMIFIRQFTWAKKPYSTHKLSTKEVLSEFPETLAQSTHQSARFFIHWQSHFHLKWHNVSSKGGWC